MNLLASVALLVSFPVVMQALRLSVLTDTATSIPQIIFFTGPWDPEEVVNNNRGFVPSGTEFRFFNYTQLDASARNISAHLELVGINGAYEAFRNLRPRALRVDLWRAMILWEHGGIYLDAKMVMVQSMSKWLNLKSQGLNLCWDDFGGFYTNQVLASPARNHDLESIIRHIVSNVQAHSYGDPTAKWPFLSITGPIAYTNALKGNGSNPQTICATNHGEGISHGWSWDGVAYDYPGRSSAVMVNSKKVHEQMRSCAECDKYQDLFNSHQLYCDEAGPACQLQGQSSLLQVYEAADSGGLANPYWSKVV